jgi:hypothetical protein
MNSSSTNDSFPFEICSRMMEKDLIMTTRISKFSCTNVLISSGTSYERIRAGDSTKAIVPISSTACFFRVLSLSYSARSWIGSRVMVLLFSPLMGAIIPLI